MQGFGAGLPALIGFQKSDFCGSTYDMCMYVSISPRGRLFWVYAYIHTYMPVESLPRYRNSASFGVFLYPAHGSFDHLLTGLHILPPWIFIQYSPPSLSKHSPLWIFIAFFSPQTCIFFPPEAQTSMFFPPTDLYILPQ